jgi:hypothetical protein
MKMNRWLVAVPLVILLASCHDLAAPNAGNVDAWLEDSGLVAVNPTSRTIYYAAIEPGLAAASYWVPCAVPDTCLSLPPAKKTTIHYAENAGWQPGSQGEQFNHWHLVPDNLDGFRPDSLRHVIAARK